MIFQQVDEIARGDKTCTQRVRKIGEYADYDPTTEAIIAVFNANGRLKWEVGKVYNVVPGRGRLTAVVCFDYDPPMVIEPERWYDDMVYRHDGMKSLQIRLLAIEGVKLNTTNRRVAVAGGTKSLQAYKKLWASINKAKGDRWEDNPMVWRLWFEVVK